MVQELLQLGDGPGKSGRPEGKLSWQSMPCGLIKKPKNWEDKLGTWKPPKCIKKKKKKSTEAELLNYYLVDYLLRLKSDYFYKNSLSSSNDNTWFIINDKVSKHFICFWWDSVLNDERRRKVPENTQHGSWRVRCVRWVRSKSSLIWQWSRKYSAKGLFSLIIQISFFYNYFDKDHFFLMGFCLLGRKKLFPTVYSVSVTCSPLSLVKISLLTWLVGIGTGQSSSLKPENQETLSFAFIVSFSLSFSLIFFTIAKTVFDYLFHQDQISLYFILASPFLSI